MAQTYFHVVGYCWSARDALQDWIIPYRYSDQQVVGALSRAMQEIQRVRPDVFLDLKYQRPLRKGDIDDGAPATYSTTDIGYASDGVSYVLGTGTTVPVPAKYFQPIVWYMQGFLQTFDMADTQDQRAQAFLTKFQQDIMTVSAA